MSCDKCKSRKTKCNNPVPGPCDYCRSIGATCQIDVGKRKQRPYYFVSEEQYGHMAKLIKHHYGPDIDLETLRSLTADIDDGTETSPTDPSATSPNPSPKKAESSAPPATPSPEKTDSQEGVPLEDIDSLHQQLGCMMQDSTGEYRYMSAVTGFSFNAAVRDLSERTSIPKTDADRDLIPPMRTVALPPTTPQSPQAANTQCYVKMPSRTLGYQYVNQYFREVHCLYWLYSTEQFHTRFENSYSSSQQTASWVCSLYAIYALAAQRSPQDDREPDERNASEYLALAKSMVPQVCDEADLDSIRALILLATALQSHCFSTSAYLHVGIAVRIAQSLGLHMDKYALSHGFVEREHARRIWWTLYIFDAEMSLRCGKPRAIVAEPSTRQAPLPSEQILNPGPNMPSGYLEISRALTQLTQVTSQTLYVEPLSTARKLLSPKVTSILSSLQSWANNVPSHLSRTACVAPSHKRSVALLHVRYWSVVILATRPFLLCSVIRAADLDSPEKRRCYDELSNICIDAVQNSLSVLKMMSDEHILSSLLFSEFVYVLELVQCCLIAYSKTKNEDHVRNTRLCLSILKSMDEVGWVQKARPEVMLQLQELGIGEEGSQTQPADHLQDFSNFLMGEDVADPYDMFFPSEQTGSYHFAEMELPDHATADEMFAQISNLSMPQFLTP